MASPSDPTYPVKKIAALLMISDRRVQQLSKEGHIPKSESGRYHLVQSVQGYIKFLRSRSEEIDADVKSADFYQHKARKMKADADIAEIEAAKRRGDAIDAQEVKQAWSMIISEVRANLLSNTPQRIASRMVGVTDEVGIKKIVKEEIGLAMQVTSETDIEELLNQYPDEDDEDENIENDDRDC